MIDFLKYQKWYVAISSIVIAVGLISIMVWGFTISIDFTGGTELSVQSEKLLSHETVVAVAKAQNIELSSVNALEKNSGLLIKTRALSTEEEQTFLSGLQDKVGEITVINAETVGPVIGAETLEKTAIASGIAIVGILLYIAYSFKKFTFAVAAISALLHDTIVVIGMYSLISHFFGAELDTLFVTALLTTMSFSVHDTIVVFDEIRAYQKRGIHNDMATYANTALTNTMVRSLNNSFTIIFMLLALTLLGGSTIRFFAVALLIGTITGTYSSPFVATPLAVWFEKLKSRKSIDH
ncbi:protein translocase subunit SecF [Candidatus Woesebacteria bacterium]|nr:protein translocase subunit SecF [Candidatus Woesebacteria bacterium]